MSIVVGIIGLFQKSEIEDTRSYAVYGMNERSMSAAMAAMARHIVIIIYARHLSLFDAKAHAAKYRPSS